METLISGLFLSAKAAQLHGAENLALVFLARAHRLAPTREDVAFSFMKICAKQGNVEGAKLIYRQLRLAWRQSPHRFIPNEKIVSLATV